MSQFTDKLLERIEKERIIPHPRMYFVLKSILVWSIIIIAALSGAVGSGIVYLKIAQFDWSSTQFLAGSAIVNALVPGLWFVVAVLFLYIVYINFRSTPLGYRPSVVKVWLASVGLTLLLGSVFYAAGISSWTDAKAQEEIPAYKKMCEHAIERWMNPDQGRLMGTIMERDENGVGFIFIDIRGATWRVDASHTIWKGKRFYGKIYLLYCIRCDHPILGSTLVSVSSHP